MHDVDDDALAAPVAHLAPSLCSTPPRPPGTSDPPLRRERRLGAALVEHLARRRARRRHARPGHRSRRRDADDGGSADHVVHLDRVATSPPWSTRSTSSPSSSTDKSGVVIHGTAGASPSACIVNNVYPAPGARLVPVALDGQRGVE